MFHWPEYVMILQQVSGVTDDKQLTIPSTTTASAADV